MQEGQSNYFKGLMLILCYLIVAASFFVHIDPTKGESLMNKMTRFKLLTTQCLCRVQMMIELINDAEGVVTLEQ